MILINYLQKGKTINENYFVGLLQKFDKKTKTKRPDLAKKSIIFPRQHMGGHFIHYNHQNS